MTTSNTKNISALIILIWILGVACSKDWLNKKPDLSTTDPSRISDYQAILDNTYNSDKYSVAFNNTQSAIDELFVGDYYVSDAVWSSLGVYERNAYTWEKDTYKGISEYIDWEFNYKRILSTNIIIEGIKKINPKNKLEQSDWNNVMGAALYFRASSHFILSQLFSEPYDVKNSKSALGIPLRLKSDLLEKTVRSSNEEVYNSITGDLLSSLSYLPVSKSVTDISKMRPTVAAAHAMLARIYLAMEKYDSALFHSEATLQIQNELLTFATDCDTTSLYGPVARFNKEVLNYNLLNNFSVFSPFQSSVDTNLYKLYDENDLRRKVYFDSLESNRIYKGSYWGLFLPYFSGLATDEIYLIKSECLARKGEVASAMNCLNQLLRTRWRPNTFVDYTAKDDDDALRQILMERRKELCFRGVKWSDLRRLNKDPRFAVTLKRKINGVEFTLPPNDLRYVFLIPPTVIAISGIQQNPR